LDSNRKFPQASKVIRWLMDERKNGRWRSTQENIYVFYALSEYFRKYEKEDPNFTGTIQMAGKQVLRELFSGRDIQVRQKSIPWTELPQGKEIEALMKKKGSGRFYYGFRMIPVKSIDFVKERLKQ